MPRLLADVVPGQSELRPWPNTGNERISPNPGSMPGSGVYSAEVASVGFPNGPTGLPQEGRELPVVESQLYQRFSGLGFILANSGDSNLMLNEPGRKRVFLQIRNSLASAGALFIGLDNAPVSEATADFIVAVGQTLTFDRAVPQNALYGFASGGGVVARIVSTNAN